MTILRFLFATSLLIPQPPVASPARMGFTVPKAPWTMGVPAGTFEVTEQKLTPDGSAGYFMLTKGTGGLTMSMFIEPVAKCTTAVECRDWAWKAEQSRLKDIQGVAKSEVGDASVVEYLVPMLGKLKIDQKNMHAYFVKEGFWVDIHLSKMGYQDTDRALFMDLIRGIEFSPKK